jgi:superfamily I DNA/RNA helicase
VNYRTSHQIRTQADRLLGTLVTDVDGNGENRSDTVSVFNGPLSMVRLLKSENEEAAFVGNWIAERAKEGVVPHEFGVFVRSPAQLDRASAAVKAAGLSFKILDEHVETASGQVSISTMHLAKGLEFRAVVVMAATMKSFPYRSASKRSATIRTCRRSMRQSVTCCTSHVRALGIICWSPASIPLPSSWTIS